MKKLKITILANKAVAPTDPSYEKLEKDWDEVEHGISDALNIKGHSPEILGVKEDIKALFDGLINLKSDIVFNVCEAFKNDSQLEMHVAAILELIGLKYTGSGPQGILLGQNKALAKQILSYHGVKSPNFTIYPVGLVELRPSDLRFPLIVKPLKEDASIGISASSIVKNDDSLKERVHFVHEKLNQVAIVEEYIEGREFYVGLIGNEKIEVLPLIELDFANMPESRGRIYSYRAKWDAKYRKEKGIKSIFPKDLSDEVINRVHLTCKIAYRSLSFRDYGRLDIRLTHDNEVYVLEANPNPYLAKGEDLADAAEKSGIPYNDFIEKVLQLAWERYK
jgi:D-alanine-D-alanine ligase